MFKFLFRRKEDGAIETTPETQRETIDRALGEINGIVAVMDVKPSVTIDPNTGGLSLALPEQMPDEALSLPAPEPKTADEAEKAPEEERV